MLRNCIILATSRCDTLKPLTSSLGPSHIVYVTLNTINDVDVLTRFSTMSNSLSIGTLHLEKESPIVKDLKHHFNHFGPTSQLLTKLLRPNNYDYKVDGLIIQQFEPTAMFMVFSVIYYLELCCAITS